MLTLPLLILPLLAAPAPPAEVEGARDLAATLEPIRASHDFPALVALVVTSDGVVAEGYTGVRERGYQTAVTRDDLFHLGSCTKAMTATLLARYVEDGTFAWDTTVGDAFPALAEAMKPVWRDVTLAQLLSHSAGAPTDLRAFPPLAVAVTANQKPLPELRLLVVQELTRAEPAFEPGTSYVYSNWGYVIAAAMLETRTGRPWEELVTARLFEPLGMKRCGFGPPRRPRERKGAADGDDKDEPPGPCGHTAKGRPAPGQDNPATIGPAGTVHAPLADWARFVQLHLLGARGDRDLLLKPETFAFLHTAQPGTQGTYGGGWMTLTRPWTKGRVLAHNGSNTLWMAWVWIAPDDDFAVLVVTNQGGEAAQTGTDAAAWALIQQQLALNAAAAVRGGER